VWCSSRHCCQQPGWSGGAMLTLLASSIRCSLSVLVGGCCTAACAGTKRQGTKHHHQATSVDHRSYIMMTCQATTAASLTAHH
jgi:hypothetical protein